MSHIQRQKTDSTSIEWVVAVARSRGMRAAVWNPCEGCSPAGEGCRFCWAAEEVSIRGCQGGQGGAARRGDSPRIRAASSKIGARFGGLTRKANDGRSVFNGAHREIPDDLEKPLRTRHPTVFFVCSRSDLFRDGVPDDLRHRIYAVMAMCPQHLFLVLTKRPETMRAYYEGRNEGGKLGAVAVLTKWCSAEMERMPDARPTPRYIVLRKAVDRIVGKPVFGQMSTGGLWTRAEWPLSNLWLGTSVWDQRSARDNILELLEVPAALRFVSYEPAIGAVDFTRLRKPDGSLKDALTGDVWIPGVGSISSRTIPGAALGWVIMGGESGSANRQVRPTHSQWVRDTRDGCRDAGVPFFFKQWGEWLPVDSGHPGLEGPGFGQFDSCPVNERGNATHVRVGKKKAGHLIDGEEILEVPASIAAQEKGMDPGPESLAGAGGARETSGVQGVGPWPRA